MIKIISTIYIFKMYIYLIEFVVVSILTISFISVRSYIGSLTKRNKKEEVVDSNRFDEITGQLKSMIPIGWYRIPDIPNNNKILECKLLDKHMIISNVDNK